MMAQSQGTLKKVIFAICLTHYLLLLQAWFAYLMNKKREICLEVKFLHIFSSFPLSTYIQEYIFLYKTVILICNFRN